MVQKPKKRSNKGVQIKSIKEHMQEDVVLDDVDQEAELLTALGEAVGEDGFRFLAQVYQLEEQRSGQPVETWLYEFEAFPDNIEAVRPTLLDKYGTGTYRVRIRKVGPGYNKLFRNVTYSLKRPPGPPATLTAAPATTEIDKVLLAIAAQGQMMTEAIKAMMNAQSAPRSSMAELVEGVKALREISGTDTATKPAAASSIKDALELAREFRDYGGEQREQGWMDVVAKAIDSPIVHELLAARGAPGAPAAAGASAIAPAPAQVPAGLAGEQARFAGAIIGQLVQMAQSGTVSSDQAADWCHENVPPKLLREVAGNDIFFEQVKKATPAIGENLSFFTALRATLKADFEDLDKNARDESAQPEVDASGQRERNPGNDEADAPGAAGSKKG